MQNQFSKGMYEATTECMPGSPFQLVAEFHWGLVPDLLTEYPKAERTLCIMLQADLLVCPCLQEHDTWCQLHVRGHQDRQKQGSATQRITCSMPANQTNPLRTSLAWFTRPQVAASSCCIKVDTVSLCGGD